MKRRLVLTALSALALAIAGPVGGAQAQAKYTLIDSKVAGTQGFGVNDQARVVGQAKQPDGSYRAFYWNSAAGQLVLLPSFAGATVNQSAAYAIDANDLVVGYGSTSDGASYGFLWRPGDAALTNLNELVDFPDGSSWTIIRATRVNDNGVILTAGARITGYDAAGNPIYQLHPVLLTPSSTSPGRYVGTDIGDPNKMEESATDLSSNGFAIGESFFYDGSTRTQITDINITNDGGVNASAEIVGTVYATHGITSSAHAAYKSSPTAPVQDLGVLGGDHSAARSINDHSVVVGDSTVNRSAKRHAFRWRPGDSKLTDLNSLLPKGTKYVLKTAARISLAGVITGEGESGTAYVLIPAAP